MPTIARTQENVISYFDQLERLVKAGRTTSPEFLQYVSRRIATLNERIGKSVTQSGEAQGFGRTSYYKLRKDRRYALALIGEDVFRILLDFLDRFNDPPAIEIRNKGDLPNRKSSKSTLYSQFAQEFEISAGELEEAQRVLPGLYSTYRPSLSRAGYIIKGCLTITQTSDGLATEEFTRYMTEGGWQDQRFKGYIWKQGGHFLLMTTDSNSQFPRLSILRPKEHVELGNERLVKELEGAYGGWSYRRDQGTFSSKILMVRAEKNITKAKLLETVGHKHVNSRSPNETIDSVIWNHVYALPQPTHESFLNF